MDLVDKDQTGIDVNSAGRIGWQSSDLYETSNEHFRPAKIGAVEDDRFQLKQLLGNPAGERRLTDSGGPYEQFVEEPLAPAFGLPRLIVQFLGNFVLSDHSQRVHPRRPDRSCSRFSNNIPSPC